MGDRGVFWACTRCETVVEARSLEQAAESHDLFEDHEFEAADPEPGVEPTR